MDLQKIAIVHRSECPAEIQRRICRDFDAELFGTFHDLREENPFPGEEYGREVFIAKVVVQLGVKVSVIRVWIVVPGLLFDPKEPAQARYSDFLIHFLYLAGVNFEDYVEYEKMKNWLSLLPDTVLEVIDDEI